MSRITDIRRSGPAFRRRAVVVDGDVWRELPAAVAAQLELEVGDEVEMSDLESRAAAAERPRAREKSVALLTARERSRAGLVQRLVDEGYARDVADEVATDFERIGLIDDERFAHALARTMANARGKGRAAIARELRAAGVTDEVAADALDAALTPDDEHAAARALADAAARRGGATVDKIASKVARRGYRLPLALAVAREAVEAAGLDDRGSEAPDAPFDD